MAQKKYVSLSKLSTFLDNLKNIFAIKNHKHTISDVTDYAIDNALSSTSTNPVQNKVLDAEFEAVSEALTVFEAALDDKQDKLTFDTIPTSNSDNSVTSGGTYDAINNAMNDVYNAIQNDLSVDSLADSIAKRDSDGRLHAAGINTTEDDLYNYFDILATGRDIYDAFTYHPSKINDLAYLMSTYGDTPFVPTASSGGWSDTPIGEDTIAYGIVQRSPSGDVKVPETPDSDDSATSKKFVENSIDSLGTSLNTELNKKAGLKTQGMTYIDANGTTKTCGNGEVFNYYNSEQITLDTTGKPTNGNLASGNYSHAEGNKTVASATGAHAEGGQTIASELYSHAEGNKTVASGMYSHAEGGNTTASNSFTHAEGNYTTASNTGAHAEGYSTIASGQYSHAEGFYTTASVDFSHVQGKYNINDTANQYAHIVGNGTSNTQRSNAHTIDWNGNAWFAGDIKIGGTGQDDANAKTLATKEDIAALTASLEEIKTYLNI